MVSKQWSDQTEMITAGRPLSSRPSPASLCVSEGPAVSQPVQRELSISMVWRGERLL